MDLALAEPELRVCRKCNQPHPVSRFNSSTSRHGKTYLGWTCQPCINAKVRTRPRARGNPLRIIYEDAKERARKTGAELGITRADVERLYEEQGGRCAVTGLPFRNNHQHEWRANPYKVSLDRIDSARGYVLGNVRLVLWGVNLALSDWGAEVYLELARAAVARADGGEL